LLTRLPSWVEKGGFVLALAAGSVNAIAIMGFNHQGVSHLSGISTLLGIEAVGADRSAAVLLIMVLLAFLAGAAISGFVIGGKSLALSWRYSVALFGEAALLVAAMFLLARGSTAGHLLASAACGLQNAMTSTYSGAVVRTTHVTGLFTDLGVSLGLRLRGEPWDRRRVWLSVAVISGFILGGVAGAWGFRDARYLALVFPATLVAILGFVALSLRSHAREFTDDAGRSD
jgi:uncharacterized membrane protein YoaK (UPF0700 family)